jgi:hypothetical protein
MKLHGNEIGASDKHCRRLAEIKNVDPSCSNLNRYFNNHANGDIPLTEAIALTIEREQIRVPRKDSVKCVEFLMAMPPELWQQTKDKDRSDLIRQWGKACMGFLKQEEYWCNGKTFLDYHLHMDETTPHLHVHIMPGEITKQGNIRLNAKKYFGGRQKLQQLQDRYFAYMNQAMPTVGFKRGEKKEFTGKSHIELKDYYKAITLAQRLGFTAKQIEEAIYKKGEEMRLKNQPTAKVQANLKEQEVQVKQQGNQKTQSAKIKI